MPAAVQSVAERLRRNVERVLVGKRATIEARYFENDVRDLITFTSVGSHFMPINVERAGLTSCARAKASGRTGAKGLRSALMPHAFAARIRG